MENIKLSEVKKLLLENLNSQMEKYGYKSTEDLFRFLVTIFAQNYVEFLWGINETEKDAKDEFYKRY